MDGNAIRRPRETCSRSGAMEDHDSQPSQRRRHPMCAMSTYNDLQRPPTRCLSWCISLSVGLTMTYNVHLPVVSPGASLCLLDLQWPTTSTYPLSLLVHLFVCWTYNDLQRPPTRCLSWCISLSVGLTMTYNVHLPVVSPGASLCLLDLQWPTTSTYPLSLLVHLFVCWTYNDLQRPPTRCLSWCISLSVGLTMTYNVHLPVVSPGASLCLLDLQWPTTSTYPLSLLVHLFVCWTYNDLQRPPTRCLSWCISLSVGLTMTYNVHLPVVSPGASLCLLPSTSVSVPWCSVQAVCFVCGIVPTRSPSEQ